MIIYEKIVQFRTWIVNTLFVFAMLLPEILNMPELVAILPPEYRPYLAVLIAVINIWMRPRPAVMKKDVVKNND